MDAKRIAAILGPTLVAVTVSELLNFQIWSSVGAPVVYLNGALLFVAGLVIVRNHNVWRLGWPLLVTLSGWALLAAGLFRLFLPEAHQASWNPTTVAAVLALTLLGLVLTGFGYLGGDRR
ncbi:MAG TPA: hypothetical protein VN814_04760 [Caulobacteraceae bacterium]|nr:hypothetical protein [Caulobacteraceae bacterium]